MALVFDKFSFINASSFAESIGMNPTLMRRCQVNDSPISAKQLKRIEKELHIVGQKSMDINF